MPPKNIKTARDLIYWEYAKSIAGSAVGDRKNCGFVMHTYEKLKEQRIHPSAILRDPVRNRKCRKRSMHSPMWIILARLITKMV
ncbi:MAG: hypothetical protein KGI02_09670 [Thaumarchaeota archaeon]|nr:hypothetical protein [Nitrososphaerota archaeon]MDE1840539.1 hypothetical protein [Nitrososphaerota archaeon]MDE1877725.1 hypothetical protein [Nitrososphaerota archaeon]